MPGLVPGIHVFGHRERSKTWMAGSIPAMTGERPHPEEPRSGVSKDESSGLSWFETREDALLAMRVYR
jgi:hypothetical protein